MQGCGGQGRALHDALRPGPIVVGGLLADRPRTRGVASTGNPAAAAALCTVAWRVRRLALATVKVPLPAQARGVHHAACGAAAGRQPALRHEALGRHQHAHVPAVDQGPAVPRVAEPRVLPCDRLDNQVARIVDAEDYEDAALERVQRQARQGPEVFVVVEVQGVVTVHAKLGL